LSNGEREGTGLQAKEKLFRRDEENIPDSSIVFCDEERTRYY
jgi:hypothetical protein